LEKKSVRKKSALIGLIFFALLITIAGCSKSSVSYQPGTFTADGSGKNGPISVEATFSRNKIENVVVLNHSETEGLADPAIKRIPEAIVSDQRLDVDAVAGATLTGDGIIEAVAKCVELAGADPDQLGNSSNDSAAVSGASEMAEITASWQIAPPPIEDSEIVETLTTEVLVVGAGNGGLFAACAAAEAGAETMILEKYASIGMTRAFIGAVGSSAQEREGIEIDKQEIATSIARYASYRVDQRLINFWIDNSGETVDWLESVLKEQNSDLFIYAESDTGKEDKAVVKSFPTQHEVRDGNRPVLHLPYLETKAKELGVEFHFETPMVQLVKSDDESRVTGVIARKSNGDYIKIEASKGVILCTGGYGSDLDMVKERNLPAYKSIVWNSSHAGNAGDGIKAAYWIGAAVDEAPTAMIFDRGGVEAGRKEGGEPFKRYFFTMGSQPFLKVNQRGERFSNESVPYDFIIHAASLEPGDLYTMVWDNDWREDLAGFHTLGCSRILPSPTGGKLNITGGIPGVEKLIAAFKEQGVVVESDTIEGLAEKLQIPADNLKATVERYNVLAEQGVDSDFGKEKDHLFALDNPPYQAITMGGLLLCTLDGLRINTDMQVLDRAGDPIEGLYAAGNVSGGFFANNYPERIPGVAVGRTMTFARHAGKVAASVE